MKALSVCSTPVYPRRFQGDTARRKIHHVHVAPRVVVRRHQGRVGRKDDVAATRADAPGRGSGKNRKSILESNGGHRVPG